MKVKCMQINVGKRVGRTEEVIELAEQKKVAILLIQEPYWNGGIKLFGSNYHLIHLPDPVNRTKAMIAVDKRFAPFKPVQMTDFTDSHMATMEFKLNDKAIIMSSIYMNGNNDDGSERDISRDLIKLDRLIEKTERENNCLIIATDSNAKSSAWGDKSDSCRRGLALLEFVSANNLTIHNDIAAGPTFVNYKKAKKKKAEKKKGTERREENGVKFGSSYIDLTFSFGLRHQRVENWTCDQKRFVLDHKLIEFELVGSPEIEPTEFALDQTRFNMKKANWLLFVQVFDKLKPTIRNEVYSNEQLEKLATKLVSAIGLAMDKTVPKTKIKSKSQPWYTEQLERAKREIVELRNKIHKKKKKKKNTQEVCDLLTDLRRMNNAYGALIRSAKKEYFEKLNRVNNVTDLWKILKKAKSVRGESYSTFTKSTGEVTNDAEEIDTDLLSHFVPEDNKCFDELKNLKIAKSSNLKKLEPDELKNTMRNTLNKKAPGPDQIGNKVVKTLFDWFEAYFEQFYNLLLANNYMPKIFKRGRLIFFQKPGRSQSNAKGLRPITLLPVLGKVLEQLLIRRISDELKRRQFASDNQHGFIKGKSTSTAIEKLTKRIRSIKKRKPKYAILLALDISSAFDRINWLHLIRNLEKAGCEGCFIEAVRQLLIDREVLYDDGRRTRVRTSNVGVPQGGRASPGLWCLGMTDLLLNLTKNNIFNIAFADDLAIVLEGRSMNELQKTFEGAVLVIENWCRSAGLRLSVEKSQILNLGKCEPVQCDLTIDGKQVPVSDKIKYLGVMLDARLEWNEHIRYIEQKANKVVEVIHRMNWTTRRMRLKEKRIIYTQVALPAIAYAHKLWSPNLNYKYQRNRLTRIQRRIILALTRCYRTTSNIKLQKLIGVLDLNDELQHGIEHCNTTKTDKRKTYDAKIEDENRLHYEIEETDSKELLWFLSNHGPHRSYLKRFGLTEEESCRLCKSRSTETVEHLMRDCDATADWFPSDQSDLVGICRAVERIVGELRKIDGQNAKHDRSIEQE